MTTFNHTDVAATGTAMDATDVTGPDGQLDAAIGDKTTLTTTIKTTLVAAVNELVTSIAAIAANSWVTTARIANLAVTTAKIAAGAVTTTELGANAVTTAKIAAANVTSTELATDAVTTAKITNLNVTGGKIARDAFAPPNVFVDATFQTTPLKIAAEWGINGHTFRWFPRSQASLDDTAVLIYDDTNNPMGVRQRTVRFKGTSSSSLLGWVIPLAEASWQAGGTISGALYCNAPSGTFALDVRCMGPSGTLLGVLQTGVGQVFSGTPQVLTISGATIDAGAAYVIFLASRTVGSSDLDLYWRYGGPGLLIPTVPSAQGYLPNQGVTRKKDADGSHLLPDYSAQVSKILSADGTSQLDVFYLADSWGQHLLIAPVIRTWLQTQAGPAGTGFGDGGLGWISFYVTFHEGSTYWEGLAASPATTRTGTWAPGDPGESARSSGSHGPDITHERTIDAAATMKLTTTVTFTSIDILTYKDTAGGTYAYNIDSTGWVAVATAGAPAVLKTTVTGLANTTHVIEFRIDTVGADGVTFLGVNLRKSGNGARLHRLSITSSTAAHWVAVDATIWQAGLAAIAAAPNLVIIGLATNDKSANTPPQTQAASLATLISRVWAVRSLTDIILASPCDVLDSGGTTYTSAQYASAQRTLASSLDVAYFDGYALMPTNADSVARAMMEPVAGAGSRHPTAAGGRHLANSLINRLLKVP